MKKELFLIVGFFALTVWAERQPYDRYQSIVERQMFGAPPPGFDPTILPSEVSRTSGKGAADGEALTQEQQQIKSAIHFSVINVTPSGETAVGFTDNGDAKQPVHYYLKVGESRNGWLVKEADPIKATMTIAKDDVEVSLSIGANSAKSGAKGADGAAPAPRAGAAAPALGNGASLFGGGAARPGGLLNSLRGRRMLREQQRQAAERQAAERAAEDKRRQEEREQQVAEEKARNEQERAEQRAQLQQIQEELRKAREERARAAAQNASAQPAEDSQ